MSVKINGKNQIHIHARLYERNPHLIAKELFRISWQGVTSFKGLD